MSTAAVVELVREQAPAPQPDSWVRPSASWPSRLPVPDDDPLGLGE